MGKLIFKLNGGTGNQLFQAAAIISLARIYNKECQFSIKDINKNIYKRNLEILPLLQELNIKESINSHRENIIYLDQCDIDHPIFYTNKSPLALAKIDIHLEGNFLNYRLHNFQVLEIFRSFFKKLNAIERVNSKNFIAIHIRELHGTGNNKIDEYIDNLDINYYLEAIKRIVKDSNFKEIKDAIVFSDLWKFPENSLLLPKVKNLLKDFGFNYINGDSKINSTLELLNIFSYSKACIISNSSLSWWGAYLGESKVFSPIMCIWEPNLKIPDHWDQIYSGEIYPRTHHRKIFFLNVIKDTNVGNLLNFNRRRIKIVNITRSIIFKLNKVKIYNKLKIWFKSKGLVIDDSHSTFF